MKIQSYTLGEPPFNYVVSFPFPDEERRMLEKCITSINLKTPKDILVSLESELAKSLEPNGYLYFRNHPNACRLWLPDFRNEVDFYNSEKKIAIEVEKSEVKRVVHAILKLVNASMTFIPKVKYGVLIVPEVYARHSKKISPFFSRVKKELPFYFQKIIPNNCNLQDVLIIVYAPAVE
jgi:hypothetical protein